MKYYLFLLLISNIYFISCKNIEPITKDENTNLSSGWVSEHKYKTYAIGYPNGNLKNTNTKESAYNAAINLVKIKIETALLKEIKNVDDKKIEDIKEFVSSKLKILDEKYIDDRYYKIIAYIEEENLLFKLKNNNL